MQGTFITKENGEREQFDEEKLRSSLLRAGAEETLTREIVVHITAELKEGMTTTEIYRHAFNLLKRGTDKPIAARYSLKRAIMELGPSGYPFESYLAEMFKIKGYDAVPRVHLRGKCAYHEVDVYAENEKEIIVAEAKFHNTPGFQTDLKTALYVESRWRDLAATGYDGRATGGKPVSFWLITNTKFSRNAIRFGTCAGLSLLGWSYPSKGNLEDLIEETGLHPLTCLTTLSKVNKQEFFEQGYVLCRDIKDHPERLRSIGLPPKKAEDVIAEAKLLCPPEPERMFA